MTSAKTFPWKKLLVVFIYLLLGLLSCQRPADELPTNPPPSNPPTLSSEKVITAFIFTTTDNPGLTSVVDGIITTDSIRVPFPGGTDLTALRPTITYKGKSVSPASKTLQNFSTVVQYIVTAEDSSTKKYSVIATTSPLSSEKVITAFSFTTSENPGLTTAVNGIVTTDSIRVLFPGGTDLTALKPTITYKGKSVSPASRVSQNFSTVLEYTVTAEDNSTKKYSVVATSPSWLDSANIYIVGRENGYIYYWENGYKYSLGTTIGGYGMANAVAVSDTDVYVVGHIGPIAKFWKNGVVTDLTNATTSADAKAIKIVGNDIYIAGIDYGANEYVIWKNGVRSLVANGAPLTYEAMGLGVSGNDVYVCGNVGVHAYVWKNGVATKLSDSSSSFVSGLFIAGTDIYISGIENGKAVYWKNGVKIVLSTETSWANAIAVSGTDVYVVGNEPFNTAVYWKNGVKTILATSVSGYAAANAIKILDTDIYIVGTIGGNSFDADVCWKNGVRHNVSLAPNTNFTTGEAYGIEVTKR